MQYSFNDQEAFDYGDREAIVIWNLRFWIIKNKANNKHQYLGEDGVLRTWTYNSHEAFQKLFWFWTKDRTRRILESLVEQQVIIKGNFNQNAYNKTCWYAFKDESRFLAAERLFAHMANLPDRDGENAKSIGQNNQIELADSQNGDGENAKSKTDIKPNIKPDEKPNLGKVLSSERVWTPSALISELNESGIKFLIKNAPNHDKYFLAETYLAWKNGEEMPDNIVGAFLGWTKRFAASKNAVNLTASKTETVGHKMKPADPNKKLFDKQIEASKALYVKFDEFTKLVGKLTAKDEGFELSPVNSFDVEKWRESLKNINVTIDVK